MCLQVIYWHLIQEFPCFWPTGSNLLLHRLFIEKGIPASLQMISFDSDTNLCPAIYVRNIFYLLMILYCYVCSSSEQWCCVKFRSTISFHKNNLFVICQGIFVTIHKNMKTVHLIYFAISWGCKSVLWRTITCISFIKKILCQCVSTICQYGKLVHPSNMWNVWNLKWVYNKTLYSIF